MIGRRSALVAVLLLAAAPAWAGAVLDRVTARRTLVVAVDRAYPPMSFFDDTGTLTGFDVEVGAAIAARLGAAVTYETPDWPLVVSGRWQGRWDLSVGSVTPTEERRRALEFPAIYYSVPAALVVHADTRTIRSPADAAGKRIGVSESSTYESYLDQTLKIAVPNSPPFVFQIRDARIVTFPNEAMVLDALATGAGSGAGAGTGDGRIDAALLALPPAMAAIRQGLPLRIAAQPVFIEPLAVAVEKGDSAFARRIAEAVEALRADGTLTRLSMRWFGTDFTR